MDGWIDGWIDGWMDGQMAVVASSYVGGQRREREEYQLKPQREYKRKFPCVWVGKNRKAAADIYSRAFWRER